MLSTTYQSISIHNENQYLTCCSTLMHPYTSGEIKTDCLLKSFQQHLLIALSLSYSTLISGWNGSF